MTTIHLNTQETDHVLLVLRLASHHLEGAPFTEDIARVIFMLKSKVETEKRAEQHRSEFAHVSSICENFVKAHKDK